MNMNVAFIARQSFNDLVCVLAFGLLIGASPAPHFQFFGLVGIAGVVFVGNRYRHDVKTVHGFIERQPGFFPAHVEHLDDGRVGSVNAVFGAAFALSNPDAVIGINAVIDEAGKREVGVAHFPWAGHVTANHKTLVQPHHFRKHPIGEQVVANGNPGCVEAVLE